MANKIYQEKQRFHDKILVVLLISAIGGLLYGAATYFLGKNTSALYAIICLALAAGLGLFLWSLTRLRYKLSVTEKNIKFKLKKSLQSSSHKIAWDDIDSCELVKTPKLAQWHGSNLSHPGEKFFSLAGRNGLMIVTKDGHRYFIGCQDVDELREALNGSTILWEVEDDDD